MKRWNSKKRKGSRSVSFKPSRQEIDDAVSDFLKGGGTIKKIVVNDRNYKEFIALNELPSAADDFLNEQ